MTATNVHHTINYIEMPSSDIEATKAFYGAAFGWTFQDWGPDYVSFSGAGVEGGFEHDADGRQPSADGALVILYSEDLAASENAVTSAGGTISRPAFSFPGGRRFHFLDPSGNELGVWSED